MALGTPTEGVWYQAGVVGGTATKSGASFVEPDHQTMGYFFEDPNTLAKSITYSGRLNFDEAAGTWQFASGTVRQFSPTAAPLSGSGSYVGRSSLTGSYAAGSGAAATFGPWTYDVESNSLAVTPELLARHWGGYGTGDVAIAADGTVTGKFVDGHPYGTCTVTGSITLAEPGTKKNRLEALLTFTNTPREGQPACKFDGQKSARAFVSVLQSTDKGVCSRSNVLQLFFRGADGEFISSLPLPLV